MSQPLASRLPPAGPRPRRRPPWARQEGRPSRLSRLIEHAFGLRLALALLAASLLLAAVNRWENCRSHQFQRGCLQRDPGGIVTVGNVEALSIVTAAFLYLLEGGQRRRRENLDAMGVILDCQQAGARLSHARNEAVERLSARGLWLDGLDLSGAHLDHLQAPHARWRQVNLSGASLQRVRLADADLQHSDLSGADLSQANLQHADLRGAKMQGCDLSYADLRGADLRDADLRGAHTGGIQLAGADLRGASLEGGPDQPQRVEPS